MLIFRLIEDGKKNIKVEVAMEVKNIRQRTVVEQLMIEIRNMIANGEFKQDERIPTELELAEKYGVSRSSVREAIKILSYLGVLESHTSRGTSISKKNRIAKEATSWSVLLGYEEMHEVFTLGTAIDTQVAIIAINNITRKVHTYNNTKKEMSKILKEMSRAAEENDLDKYTEIFSEYFRVLYKTSYNTVFLSLNECIDSLIVKKVCKAYHMTNNLVNATNYLAKIWESIIECNLEKSIKTVQDYGEFAYKIFYQCGMMEE